jgi:hypothetical protein
MPHAAGIKSHCEGAVALHASVWIGTMKKAVWVLLCSFITLPGLAQTASRDIVLLLDTSASMSDYYLEVRDYLSGPFLQEFLRLGDTFHLISFSDRTRLEISQRVNGQSDIEAIVGRLLLMYPLDPYSDIVSALRFAERYITSLPNSRAKSLVVISDGDNNPAPGTRLESVNIQNLIHEIAVRLNHSGVSFEFIPIPRGSRPRLSSPATPSLVPETQAPTASRPSTAPPVPETQAPLSAPAPKKPSQPIKWPRITLPALSIPADALFFVVIGAGGLMLFAIAALALLTATRLHNAPNRMMGVVAEQSLFSPENASDTIPPILSLFVKDQPAIRGRQNLHILQPGYSLSLGGDKSDDFVISIVTVPRCIARVRFDGQHYTFIPQKRQSLPDIGSTSVQDCIGKEIRVVHKNFEVHLSIEQRENPLRELGSFLHSVNSYSR